VKNLRMIAAMSVALLLCLAPAAPAQEAQADMEKAVAAVNQAQQILGREGFSIYFGSAFAAGLVIVGAAYGIGRIGSHAVESMARQPEVAGSINTAMIIAAALIEGVTFFALIICLMGI